MTFEKEKEYAYKCDCCKSEKIFATKTKCEKGDICYECRNHVWEVAGIPNPTLKETIIAKNIKKNKEGKYMCNEGEKINRELIQREIEEINLI